MDVKLISIDGEDRGTEGIDDRLFVDEIRYDIVQRVVRWQRAKRRSGCHKVKGVGEVKGSNRKPYRQKGTGRARQGSNYAAQMRGGAKVFGPVVRSHAHKLPKKIRRLGLRSALTDKLRADRLYVIDSLVVEKIKTSSLCTLLHNNPSVPSGGLFVVDSSDAHQLFLRAVSNIPKFDCILPMGLNVYDIINHDGLFLSREVLRSLEDRLV